MLSNSSPACSLEAEEVSDSVKYTLPTVSSSAPEILRILFNLGIYLYECKYKQLHLI